MTHALVLVSSRCSMEKISPSTTTRPESMEMVFSGTGIALDGLAIQQIGIGSRRNLGLGRRLLLLGQMFHGALTDFLRGLKQRLRVQLFPHLNVNLHRGFKHILEPALCPGHMGPQHVLAVSPQLKHHGLPLQAIPGSPPEWTYRVQTAP